MLIELSDHVRFYLLLAGVLSLVVAAVIIMFTASTLSTCEKIEGAG